MGFYEFEREMKLMCIWLGHVNECGVVQEVATPWVCCVTVGLFPTWLSEAVQQPPVCCNCGGESTCGVVAATVR